METYPRAAVERAMKIQEVILRAIAKKITGGRWGRSSDCASDKCGARRSVMRILVTTVFSIVA
jgi:hypothetical protein